MRSIRVHVSLLLAAILIAAVSLAQVATSRLEGTVQDASGAVVPGAKVEVVNVKTQVRTETTADASGRYIFASLPAATYNLSAEAPGFRKTVNANLMLNVGITVTEVLTLEVGQLSDSVQVEAKEVRVQTADAQVGRSVTLRDIDTLPQLNRNPILLSVFNAGVQIDPTGYDFSRVNGTRQGSNNATLDGIEVNDPVAPRLGLSMTPNTTDTVAEFRIITNGGKAEYGRNAGAQVEMITRSGTNEFHGDLYDYLRNTTLNANTYFSNQQRLSVPKYIRNIFGGDVGGRVIKDRTFFFGSYEGGRTRQEKLVNRTTLTKELRSGLFRWKDSTGAINQYDIYANDPRHIGMDPWAKKNYFDLMPDANNTDAGDGLNTGGYRFNAPNNAYNDQYTFKVDHNLTDNHRLFFRWSWMRSYSIDGANNAEASYPGLPAGQNGGRRRGFSAGSTWTIGSSMVNDLRVGQQRTNSDFPRPRIHGLQMSASLFTDPLGPSDYGQGRTVPIWDVTDNLTKVKGNHTIKGGFTLRFVQQDGWREDYTWPLVTTYVSNGNTVPASTGPQGLSSTDRSTFEQAYNDLLGRMSYVYLRYYSDLTKFQEPGTRRFRSTMTREYGFFIQDDWKLHPRFTLNAGLRYELNGVAYDRNGMQGALQPADKINASNALTNITVQKGGAWYNNDLNNFAPRLGFAWDPKGDGKWAVRGSAGIFYDRMINAVFTPVDNNTPGFNSPQNAYPNQNGTDLRINDGAPTPAMPAAPSLDVPVNRVQSGAVMVPNLRTGYVGQFSFNVQREIFRNTVLEVGYVGSHGVKLFYQDNLNQSKIYDSGFLAAFQELAANRNNTDPNNMLVKMFGSAATAISRIGSSSLTNGTVGAAANTVDTNYYANYANAGLSQTLLRNFPQFSTMFLGTNDGRSYYNSLQVSFRRQQGAFKFQANYTYSKAMDNWASEGNGTNASTVMDYRNIRLNRGRSDFDHPHSFNSSFSYTLPVGTNRRFLGSAPRWVDSLVGGWDVGVLSTWQSGSPLTIATGRYTGPNASASAWAVYNGDRSIGAIDRRLDGTYFFTDAQKAMFTFPTAGTIGTAGRNTFRGPRFFDIDASLSKAFKFTETKMLMFRAEAFNALNNVNFGNPALSIGTPASFGRISSTIGPNGSGGARLMQMALRFKF